MTKRELLLALDKLGDEAERLLAAAQRNEVETTKDILEEVVKSINNNWIPIRRELLKD